MSENRITNQPHQSPARQALIEAFCLLYRDKPMEQISIRELTARAGYHRCTFYQYFDNLEEVRDATELFFLEILIEKRKKISVHDNNFLSTILSIYNDYPIYMNALYGNYGFIHFTDRLKAMVPLDLPNMEIPDNHLKDYYIEFYLSGITSLVRLWINRGRDLTNNEFIHLMMTLHHIDFNK